MGIVIYIHSYIHYICTIYILNTVYMKTDHFIFTMSVLLLRIMDMIGHKPNNTDIIKTKYKCI